MKREHLSIRKMCHKTAAAVVIALAMISVFSFSAADEAQAASTIKVYVTISDQGELARAKDGSAMAAKEVTVTDVNEDGEYSYDEALQAAHEQYHEDGADGYRASETQYGVSVSTLWGVSDEPNYLFFINSQGITSDVGTDKVSVGDYLTAAHMSDTVRWSDQITSFDKNTCQTTAGRSVTLNLKGHLGMAWTDEQKEDLPIPGADVFDTQGNDYGKTDDEGNVTLTFDKAGTYYVTARGMTKEITEAENMYVGDGYYFMKTGDEDALGNAIYGKMGTKLDYLYGYTQTDYGEGPYPWDEILWMSEDDFYDGEYDTEPFEDGYFLCSDRIIFNCPLIAPVCVVTVKEQPSTPIYRLYNPTSKEHLYTSSKNEYTVLAGRGWKQEGVGWYAPKKGKAVYRLYNPKSGDHHYTADANEAKTLTGRYGWKYDNNGKALYYSGGTVSVYRLYNKSLKRGAHHFTKSLNEYKTLPKYGWKQEGTAFYAVK